MVSLHSMDKTCFLCLGVQPISAKVTTKEFLNSFRDILCAARLDVHNTHAHRYAQRQIHGRERANDRERKLEQGTSLSVSVEWGVASGMLEAGVGVGNWVG